MMNRAASRLLWAAVPLGCFVGGYYGAAIATAAVTRVDPVMAIDRLIPCAPDFVWVYLAGLAAPFLPLFALPRSLLPKAMASYSLLILTAVVLFLVFPTDAGSLRALCGDPPWSLALLYRLDPATNMFPSLHVGLATLSCLWLVEAGSRWGRVAAALALGQALAVLLIKQHTLADVAMGTALAWLSYRLALARSFSPATQP